MKINLHIILVAAIGLASFGSHGQSKPKDPDVSNTGSTAVYKVKQADGSVLYTDSPSPEGATVEFDAKTQNVVSSPSVPKPAQPQTTKTEKKKYEVTIASPAPGATLRNNAGNLTIRANQPTSVKAPRYQLIFDGALLESNTTGVFNLNGINRGEHQYKVELTDNKGKTLASSALQTLFLHQASALINSN
ncbi:DUF4124 domain-containing protein [Alteromonas sp. 1_MG-2023]|uniref:DUF4124 domain-containing protein n=1 Tax=Alteromonas sp. 1_MG-2023 TaxID=3062669 RepID=UPI0026E11C90|nr:DUF4124 domain-containing protein [Alteromonas sp. 1_MG-2023]MDO6567273.1 DUF4124 domain-containing protein [Alteromonas sp. 1_MG-2023]